MLRVGVELSSFLFTSAGVTYITHWDGIGHNGRWEHSFLAPVDDESATWSRCPCPAINASEWSLSFTSQGSSPPPPS